MRGQRVALDGRYSSWRSITAGMPQGSILGPLFFLFNDLSNGLSSNLELFADDTFFIYLQQKHLHKWLKWRLEMSLNKPQWASSQILLNKFRKWVIFSLKMKRSWHLQLHFYNQGSQWGFWKNSRRIQEQISVYLIQNRKFKLKLKPKLAVQYLANQGITYWPKRVYNPMD